MTKFRRTVSRSALTIFLGSGVMSAATLAADLSQYRGFRFGSDLSIVAEHAGANPSQAKVIHHRPALIQELAWGPSPWVPLPGQNRPKRWFSASTTANCF